MISVKNLTFSYGKKIVLDDISTVFEKEKFYAVIGLNGSGKTTLIKILSKLLVSDTGEMTIDSLDYSKIRRKDFAKKISLLPQGRNIPNMCVFDFVSAGRYPYLDLSKKLTNEDLDIVYHSMQLTDTEKFAKSSLKKLSGGERQRVYLAMLIAQNTPYILLDEPISHLDLASQYKMLNILHDLKSSGKCIIAVLHELSIAMKFADDIKVIDKGRIKFEGTSKNLTDSDIIERVFNVKCTRVSIDGREHYIFDENN